MKAAFLSFILIYTIYTSTGQVTIEVDSSAPVQQEQEEPKKKFDPSRLVFGGNLGASFGDFTFVNISPQVGYMFSPLLTAGAGINYVHSSYKTRYSNEEITETFNYAGLNVFGRIFPTNFLFASLQPEVNYSWGKIKFENNTQPDVKQNSEWIPTLLVGAGVMMGGQRGRGGLMLSVQYDLAQHPRSPYGTSPFIGMGFSF